MDLKYITATQTLEVVYEGQRRTFRLHSVSTHSDGLDAAVEALSQGLEDIKLNDASRVWTVGWDTIVNIVDDHEDQEKVVFVETSIHANGLTAHAHQANTTRCPNLSIRLIQ